MPSSKDHHAVSGRFVKLGALKTSLHACFGLVGLLFQFCLAPLNDCFPKRPDKQKAWVQGSYFWTLAVSMVVTIYINKPCVHIQQCLFVHSIMMKGALNPACSMYFPYLYMGSAQGI